MSQQPPSVNAGARPNIGGESRIQPATPGAIQAAVGALEAGGLVGLPTETVYGLAADATNGAAVARIFEAKGRPLFNPLIAHVASMEMALREGQLDKSAQKLAERFWPGPLTLVVPASTKGKVSDLARAGLPTLALRWPAHPIAEALIKAYGKPLAAPSANRSGRISTTDAAAVSEELGSAVDVILDGGACPVGVESTIIGWHDGRMSLLRPGGLSVEEIEAMAGTRIVTRQTHGLGDSAVIAPGMLASHYAPDAAVQLECLNLAAAEAILAFGPVPSTAPAHACIAQLSVNQDLREAASNLFRHMRWLDSTAPKIIHVMPIPNDGLGRAINDRLQRAAFPRV